MGLDDLRARGQEMHTRAAHNPYDNAKAECFVKTPKVEVVYFVTYETCEDVAADHTRTFNVQVCNT